MKKKLISILMFMSLPLTDWLFMKYLLINEFDPISITIVISVYLSLIKYVKMEKNCGSKYQHDWTAKEVGIHIN